MNDNKLLNQIGDLIDKKLDPLKTDLKGVKIDLSSVKTDLKGVKTDLNGVKTDLKGVKTDLNGVKTDLKGVKQQLGTVEMKVELVNERVGKAQQELQQSIKQSQEDTIDTLSALIHTGYNLHEKRIKKIEDALQITNPQQ